MHVNPAGRIVREVGSPAQRMLSQLAKGSRVGIVTMLGSMCPITRAHVQMMVEARSLLLDKKMDGEYAECIGLLSLNADSYVHAKLQTGSPGKGCSYISERQELVELSIADIPWLSLSANCEREALEGLPRLFPNLQFEHFRVNGEDDVIRFQKWRHAGPTKRFITIGRKNSGQQSLEELQTEHFLIGAPVGQISSTQVREACRAQNRAALEAMVHPRVAAWLLAREGGA